MSKKRNCDFRYKFKFFGVRFLAQPGNILATIFDFSRPKAIAVKSLLITFWPRSKLSCRIIRGPDFACEIFGIFLFIFLIIFNQINSNCTVFSWHLAIDVSANLVGSSRYQFLRMLIVTCWRESGKLLLSSREIIKKSLGFGDKDVELKKFSFLISYP